MTGERPGSYQWPTAITEIFPDGRYQHHADVEASLNQAHVPALWVPYSPDIETALDASGFDHVARLGTDDLRYGIKHQGKLMDMAGYITCLVEEHDPQAAVIESRARAERGLEWRSVWLQPSGYEPAPEEPAETPARRVPLRWALPIIGRRH